MSDLVTLQPWMQQVLLVLGGLLLGWLTERFILRVLRRWAAKTESKWDDIFADALHPMPIVWCAMAGVWAAVLVRGVDPLVQQVVSQALMVLLIATVTIVIARMASGSVDYYAARTGGRLPATSLVNNLVKLLIGLLGLFIILQNLNIQITPLITALGIGGLAVALALQDTLGNLFAGVSIILSGQVRPGDYLKLASSEEGFVTDVKARNTTIRTFPNQNLVVVPNSVLASTILTNYSLPERSLWITVEVGVSYDSDLEFVENVAIEVANEAFEAVEGQPPRQVPEVRFHEFGDSSINFMVLIQAAAFTDQFHIRHEFIKRLHSRFQTEGIDIPFPIRTVYMRKEGE